MLSENDPTTKELMQSVWQGENITEVLNTALLRAKTSQGLDRTMFLEIAALAAARGSTEDLELYVGERLKLKHESEASEDSEIIAAYIILNLANPIIHFNNYKLLESLREKTVDLKISNDHFSKKRRVMAQICEELAKGESPSSEKMKLLYNKL